MLCASVASWSAARAKLTESERQKGKGKYVNVEVDEVWTHPPLGKALLSLSLSFFQLRASAKTWIIPSDLFLFLFLFFPLRDSLCMRDEMV